MVAPYTAFGKTLNVEAEIWQNDKPTHGTEWDEDLWVVRGEDYYALMSPQLKGKRVRIITRENWLRAVRTQAA